MRSYIEIGKIVAPHGVAGALRVEPWCDSPQVLAGMKRVFFPPLAKGEPYREVAVLRGSVQGNRVLLTLSGTDSREKAEGLRNCLLYAFREDIPVPEGAFLIDDLKGLPVIDADTGRLYGTLRDVLSGPAGELYEIASDKGPVLLPAVPEFIKKNRAGGRDLHHADPGIL